MCASIEDLTRWDCNFDTECVGGDGFTEQMTTCVRLQDYSGDAIGFLIGSGELIREILPPSLV